MKNVISLLEAELRFYKESLIVLKNRTHVTGYEEQVVKTESRIREFTSAIKILNECSEKIWKFEN